MRRLRTLMAAVLLAAVLSAALARTATVVRLSTPLESGTWVSWGRLQVSSYRSRHHRVFSAGWDDAAPRPSLPPEVPSR